MRSPYKSIALLLVTLVSAGCDAAGPLVPEGTTAVQLSLAASSIEVGQTTAATAVVRDRHGVPLDGAQTTYASDAPEIAAVSPTTGEVSGVAPGTTQISATSGGSSDRKTIRVFSSPVRINEVYPNADRPGGWVEIYNPTADTIDVSDWTITAGDIFRGFTIPATVKIPPLGFVAVNEGLFPRGLAAADEVYLFSRFGVQVDTYAWSASATASFGRCPDGSGPFVELTELTRKADNACPAAFAGVGVRGTYGPPTPSARAPRFSFRPAAPSE